MSKQPFETTNKTDHANNKTEKSNTKAEPQEHGGPSGLEPTRYGDWERGGRCIDF